MRGSAEPAFFHDGDDEEASDTREYHPSLIGSSRTEERLHEANPVITLSG